MSVLEQTFLSAIYRLCSDYDVKYHHCTDSRKCAGVGLPDLVICGTRSIIWRELKSSPVDQPTSGQVMWMYYLRAAGQDIKIWTPADLDSGSIETELTSLTW
jgi:hypothetical protein